MEVWRRVDEGLASLLEDIAQHIGARTLFVAALTESLFTSVHLYDRESGHEWGRRSMPLRQSFCHLVFETREEVCIPDTHQHPKRLDIGPQAAGAYLGVPIFLADGSLFGTLCATHPIPYPFSEEDRQRLRLVAKGLGLVFDLERIALRDPLTGLYGRQYLDFLSSGFEEGSPLGDGVRFGLVMADFDALKSVNDTYGHETGDHVIQVLADRVRYACDPYTVVRLGGDEFVAIVSPLSDDAELVRVAHAVFRIADQRVALPGGQTVAVGVSVGTGTFPDNGETLEDVLAHADMEMYRNKRKSAN